MPDKLIANHYLCWLLQTTNFLRSQQLISCNKFQHVKNDNSSNFILLIPSLPSTFFRLDADAELTVSAHINTPPYNTVIGGDNAICPTIIINVTNNQITNIKNY